MEASEIEFQIKRVCVRVSAYQEDWVKRFGRAVKRVGGSYTACRGYKDMRSVTLPWPEGRAVADEIIAANPRPRSVVLIEQLDHNMVDQAYLERRLARVSWVEVHSVHNSAELETAVRAALERVLRESKNPIVVQDSPEHEAAQRAVRMATLRSCIKHAQELADRLPRMRAELAELERQ